MNPTKSRYAIAALAISLALAGCGQHSEVSTQSSGAGQAVPEQATILIPAGTVYEGKLMQPINTKTSHDGDTFQLAQTDTLFHKNATLHGTTIDGHLENVVAAGPMRKAALTLVFDDISMPDGVKAPINVKLESFKAFEPKSHHFRTLAMMTSGAIIGHMAAKHSGHEHGGMMGAIGGFALSQELKTDIVVPAGTVVQLKLVNPVTAPTAESPAP